MASNALLLQLYFGRLSGGVSLRMCIASRANEMPFLVRIVRGLKEEEPRACFASFGGHWKTKKKKKAVMTLIQAT
jgi:hypothetical protein